MSVWGSVPDWVEAIGTSGAFVAGLLLLRRQLSELRALETMREREAARHVAAWWKWDSALPEPRYRIFVRNGGADPVYKCRSEIVFTDGRDSVSYYLPLLPPEETEEFLVSPRDLDVAPGDYPRSPDPFATVELSFEASDGRVWRRDGDGTLTELTTQP